MVHHRRGLRRLLRDDALLDRVEADWQAAGLDTRRAAVVRYAIKLTVSPSEMVADDVKALRDAGLTDLDILQLCECVAYYAFVNRIADGLGVELEP